MAGLAPPPGRRRETDRLDTAGDAAEDGVLAHGSPGDLLRALLLVPSRDLLSFASVQHNHSHCDFSIHWIF